MHRLIAGVEALREATEAQLAAARRLDVPAVQALTARRSDLLFELEVARAEPVPDALRPDLKAALTGLSRAEERLKGVLDAVVRSFSSGAATYDRAGRVGGGRS